MIVRTLLFASTTLLLLQGSAANDNAFPKSGRDQSTGRIEGRMLAFPNAAHLPQVRVRAVELYASDSPRVTAKANVDAEGGFVFEEVPSGKARLNPIFEVGTQAWPVACPTALRLPATVRAGETTKLVLFGKGRPVTGTIVPPLAVKPEHCRVRLSYLAPPTRGARGPDGRILHNPANDIYAALSARKLEADVDAQGQFRIDGVREGNYHISVGVTRMPNAPILVFEAVTKPGHSHVEYGKLTIPLAAEAVIDKPHSLGSLSFRIQP